MMRRLSSLKVCIFGSLLYLLSCGVDAPSEVVAALDRIPATIDYNFHVQPILSDRCFACHGPDAANQQADLRLDTPEGAYAALSSGNGRAIVAGKPGQSELIERIFSKDPEIVMPTPESNLYLTDEEKAILLRWIEQGAEYKAHWAFTPPNLPPVPESGASWARNEIDHFIAQQLSLKDVRPAPEAERYQLIRRLFFDLTGLPPSLEELDHWLAAPETTYYESLVDSLLATSAYGERMAAHWMDVARFADSEGYLDDYHHELWPYRDWVIQAFNDNLSYDQFILWQVGGDQMPEPGTEQILATTFNRTHKQNSEGGIIPEEFRVEYVADRANTVGTAFLGLTLGCARCHDHKYDPISQEDYFSMFAFFNSTIERGDGIFALNASENGTLDLSQDLAMNAGPTLPLPSPTTKEARNNLKAYVQELEEQQQAAAAANEERAQQWLSQRLDISAFEQAIQSATLGHFDFAGAADGRTPNLAEGGQPATYHELELVSGRSDLGLRSDAAGLWSVADDQLSFEHAQPFTISFAVKTPKAYDNALVLFNNNWRTAGYRGWDVVQDSSSLHFRLNHAHPFQSLEIVDQDSLPHNEWVHYVWTYDGSGDANGMRLYRDGQAAEITILRNHLLRSSRPYPNGSPQLIYTNYPGMAIGNRHYEQDFTGGVLDDIRILDREAGQLVAAYLYQKEQALNSLVAVLPPDTGQYGQVEAPRRSSTLGVSPSPTTDADWSSLLAEFYDLFIDRDQASYRSELEAARTELIAAIDTVREVMVMGDWEEERPTYLLDRGVYDAPAQQVQRDVPADILSWPEDLPRNRYGLGKWLIADDHPLTSRVAVNQYWYLIFGRGIVETAEDFGAQGALPTHPELLDWLAVDFRTNGWDIKRLMKQLVMSATYRQSSVIRPELEEIDPDNYLLARGPRYRRSAEMVRDQALAVSGLLDERVGGRSAFPYQPEGLWLETNGHVHSKPYVIDRENGLYRRSLYTFFKRNAPPPSMLIFDASIRAECQVRRRLSSTPLQALVLLNDPQILEASRALAEQSLRQFQEMEAALTAIFRTLTSRPPSSREKAILLEQLVTEQRYFTADKNRARAYLAVGVHPPDPDLPLVEVAALSRMANTILNTTEAYYKN